MVRINSSARITFSLRILEFSIGLFFFFKASVSFCDGAKATTVIAALM